MPSIVVQHHEQVGQPNGARTGRVLIAVDGLAQAASLPGSRRRPGGGLRRRFRRRPALLRAANAGHDAVGAELVAAEHRPHHRLMRRRDGFSPGAERLEAGEALLDRLPAAGPAVQADLDPRPAAGGHVGQQSRQSGPAGPAPPPGPRAVPDGGFAPGPSGPCSPARR